MTVTRKNPKLKKAVVLTREVKDLILQYMHEGLDISMICKKFPNDVPARETIYRASQKDKEFAEEINSAYSILLMIRLDELNELSLLTASEAYPGIDFREAEATLKRRVDTGKFVLGKMAPILSSRFNKVDKLEVSGIDSPQLAIVNYYMQEPVKKVIDVVPTRELLED